MIFAPLRKSLQSRFPASYQMVASVRFFLYCKRRLGAIQDLIHRVVFSNDEIIVRRGPFEGMRYYNKTIWGTITSKWLGFYEEEIQPVVEEVLRSDYPLVVDIGAAEGYYAVGLALKMPGAKVISFDIDPIARYRQRQLAELNGVSNLEIRELFEASALDSMPRGMTLVICDVEGAEVLLLKPEDSPRFAECDLLVEVHRSGDLSIPQVEQLLTGRFSATHGITRFEQRGRDAEAACEIIPELRKLDREQVAFALDEGRYSGQVWLWMRSSAARSA